MATKERIERPKQTIKPNVSSLSSEIKLKSAQAIQAVVNAIKEKHL